MSLIKTQPKLLVGKANSAGERHCNKQRAKRLFRSALEPDLRPVPGSHFARAGKSA